MLGSQLAAKTHQIKISGQLFSQIFGGGGGGGGGGMPDPPRKAQFAQRLFHIHIFTVQITGKVTHASE